MRITASPLIVDPQIILSFPDALVFAKGPVLHDALPLSRGLDDLPLALPRDYTVNFFLPFARLLLSTALPPFVAIRTRKPWVRFILVLLKFVNVFFIVWSPVKINKFAYRP
jgi:hypothetical protein